MSHRLSAQHVPARRRVARSYAKERDLSDAALGLDQLFEKGVALVVGAIIAAISRPRRIAPLFMWGAACAITSMLISSAMRDNKAMILYRSTSPIARVANRALSAPSAE
jgi:hypothetical protein